MKNTKKNKYLGRDFQDYLQTELRHPRSKAWFDEYGRQLEIAYQIMKLRKRRAISQMALAKKIGTSQSNIARMEGGRQNFTISLLDKVAKALEVDLMVKLG